MNGSWYARSDLTGRVYERTQTPSTQEWPLSMTDQSLLIHEVSERNKNSARQIVCRKK